LVGHVLGIVVGFGFCGWDFHQPLDGTAGYRDTFSVQLKPHFAGAVDSEVLRVHPGDVFAEFLIAARRRRGFTPVRIVIGGRGDRDAVRTEHPANRRDPEPAGVTVDVLHDQPRRRSSSAAAKNAGCLQDVVGQP
jgi:hypothetical protein